MNRINIKIAIIITIGVFVACTSTNRYLYRERESDNYPFNDDVQLIVENGDYKTTDEEILINGYYINRSGKDILLPMKYIRPEFYFSDKSIKVSHIINLNHGYPNLEFEKLSNKKRKSIIRNTCEPYIDLLGYYKLQENDTLFQVYDLKELHYTGFKEGQKYQAIMKVYIADKIKEYCPMIWSGSIKSDTISFLMMK